MNGISVEELPKFTPTFKDGGNALVFNGSLSDTTAGFGGGSFWKDNNKTCRSPLNSIGGDAPHNNLPPYKVVYIFVRVG